MATVTLSKKALKRGIGNATRTNDWDDLITVVNALTTLVTELKADHATFKTAVDGIETLIEELSADHATFKTVVDELTTDLSAHVHGGITAGAANTSAGPTITATAPATLSTANPASAPATLSAATPDTLALDK